MRLDRFLHCIRLVKSRALAQALIEQGHIRHNGRAISRPSHAVAPGQIWTIAVAGRVVVIGVLTLPQRRGPAAEARGHYRLIDGAGVDEPPPPGLAQAPD